MTSGSTTGEEEELLEAVGGTGGSGHDTLDADHDVRPVLVEVAVLEAEAEAEGGGGGGCVGGAA